VIEAARLNYKYVKGIILLSPISSGLKIALNNYDSSKYKEIDVFCNDLKIDQISVPIYIIHGQEDELIKVKHCQNMAKKAKRVKEWYPVEGNHNNIIQRYRYKFYSNVKNFLEIINEYAYDELTAKNNTNKETNNYANDSIPSFFNYNNNLCYNVDTSASPYNQTYMQQQKNFENISIKSSVKTINNKHKKDSSRKYVNNELKESMISDKKSLHNKNYSFNFKKDFLNSKIGSPSIHNK
jgi:hypothetical protein